MLSIYQLKPKFQSLLRPLVRKLAVFGVTANQVTITAMLLSVATSISLLWFSNIYYLWLLPLILLIRMALNAVDGMLAREHDQQSKLGTFLNEVADIISDLALLSTLLIIPQINAVILLMFMALAVIAEFCGVMGPMVGSTRQYQGPMGKSDRAFMLSLIVIFAVCFPAYLSFINSGLLIAILLSMVTIFNRVKAAINDPSLTDIKE